MILGSAIIIWFPLVCYRSLWVQHCVVNNILKRALNTCRFLLQIVKVTFRVLVVSGLLCNYLLQLLQLFFHHVHVNFLKALEKLQFITMHLS